MYCSSLKAFVLVADSPSVEDVTELLKSASNSNRESAMQARSFRRQLNKTDTYTRQTTNDEESLKKIDIDGVGYSTSGLVAQVRGCSGFEIKSYF